MRINPYELSIHDPEYYNELYVGSSKRRTNFWPLFQGCTDDTDGEFFGTAELFKTMVQCPTLTCSSQPLHDHRSRLASPEAKAF